MNPILLLLASLAYSYFLVSKAPNGLPRLFFNTPTFYVFAIIPWYFSSSSFFRGLWSYFITWIASFKLLLFCFDQGGPLTFSINFIDFLLLTIFPLKIRESTNPSSQPKTTETSKVFKLIIFIVILFRLNMGYGPFVTLVCGVTMVRAMARYEPVPIFNHPYLATSLQDFWGRRWNLLSSYILRLTIYNPTRKTFTGLIGFGPAKVVALLTTLGVSGIMHEVMFYYITCGKRPAWDVTWFFVVQGVCMVFEGTLKKLARIMGWTILVHPVISVVFTIAFVVATGYWLLVLPTLRKAQNECGIRVEGFSFQII
ncbi:putative acyltransferase [Tripterygium wilfordii]|uniref:Putative acyltransferase n=1 Tax=Tripterygium wilfordii TaxID=458696 RepID=A0A7J7C357_TRIWF|nr:putative acyltransferase [Tripterygium wilfordii]